MEIRFVKLGGDRHLLAVRRDDGSTDEIELATRSFLNHDLAHLAVEAELGLTGAFWGSVASGAALSSVGLEGNEIVTAERLAGPLQTLMRSANDGDEIRAGLRTIAPDIVDEVAAERVAERVRRLAGQWRATAVREAMVLTWPLAPLNGGVPASG